MNFNKALLLSGIGIAGAAAYLVYLNRKTHRTEPEDSVVLEDLSAEPGKTPIVEPTEPCFECPICFEERCLASIPECGHTICGSCIRDILNKGVNDKCGFCRAPLKRDRRLYKSSFRVLPKNVTVEDLNLALHAAVTEGNVGFARFYLEKGAEVNSDPYENAKCLMLAVAQKSDAMFDLLLEYGADVNSKDSYGRTLVHAAAREGSVAMLTKLKSFGLPFDTKSSSGEAPIHSAIPSGSLETVKFLHQEGADLNAQTNLNCTPLALAALKNRADILKYLLQNGATVAPELSSALCARTSLECLQVFAEGGIPLDVDAGISPLMGACRKRRMDTVQFLLKHGVDPNYADEEGRTAFLAAATANWVEGLKVLLDHGADLHVRNRAGANAVDHATIGNSMDALLFLVEQGCDVNSRLKAHPELNYWHTSLAHVLGQHLYDVAEALLRAGADPEANLGDVEAETILQRSILFQDPTAVRLLLRYGASYDTPDSHGFQPIQYAKQTGNAEIVEALTNAGADATLPPARYPALPDSIAHLFQNQQQAG